MKRNLLYVLILLILPLGILNAQTYIWSSNCENLAGWVWDDIDGDGTNWFYYTGGESQGFLPGQFIASPSMSASPDNAIRTPSFFIPGTSTDITLSFRIAASNDVLYQESYGIYIQEVGVGTPYDNLIHQATLNDGGDNSAVMVNVPIANSFAGKNVNISIRHFNTTNQEFLMVDDILVESNETLSLDTAAFESFSFYPNPVRTSLNFNAVQPISKVQIFNLLGQEVLTFERTNVNLDVLNIESLNAGNYLMKVYIDRASKVFRLVKQ